MNIRIRFTLNAKGAAKLQQEEFLTVLYDCSSPWSDRRYRKRLKICDEGISPLSSVIAYVSIFFMAR